MSRVPFDIILRRLNWLVPSSQHRKPVTFLKVRERSRIPHCECGTGRISADPELERPTSGIPERSGTHIIFSVVIMA